MKKIILLLTLLSFFFSCSDNGFNNSNPYIPNYNFSIAIDMNSVDNSKLLYMNNAIYDSRGGYNAFDATCPNQVLSSCSILHFKNSDSIDPLKIDYAYLVCPCDGAEYFLYSGQSPGKQYPLKQYRVVNMGNNELRVSN
jgi:nitrite reductase/ring-hydroxylating ferredoxin subunit